MTGAAVETHGLGKRFGSTWALRDCSITLPAGSVVGLVGANGAGKTTLLRMLAGLARPSVGAAFVHGRHPADSAEFLASIGYLAQEVPLYRRWTAADHLAMAAHMNPVWDDERARDRLDQLAIPLDRRVEHLSGGMRAQVALALVIGKAPPVLLLDEPFAALDPFARHEFMSSLLGALAERPATVLLSSHLLPDLERVCDHLLVVDRGVPVVCESIEHLVSSHKLLTGPASGAEAIARDQIVVSRTSWGARTASWSSCAHRSPIHAGAWTISTWRRSCWPTSAALPRQLAWWGWSDDLVAGPPAPHVLGRHGDLDRAVRDRGGGHRGAHGRCVRVGAPVRERRVSPGREVVPGLRRDHRRRPPDPHRAVDLRRVRCDAHRTGDRGTHERARLDPEHPAPPLARDEDRGCGGRGRWSSPAL